MFHFRTASFVFAILMTPDGPFAVLLYVFSKVSSTGGVLALLFVCVTVIHSLKIVHAY